MCKFEITGSPTSLWRPAAVDPSALSWSQEVTEAGGSDRSRETKLEAENSFFIGASRKAKIERGRVSRGERPFKIL